MRSLLQRLAARPFATIEVVCEDDADDEETSESKADDERDQGFFVGVWLATLRS